MTQLLVSDIHAHYDQSHVLQGVNFEIQPATITTILGRNGSGRSTTLKALMGIVAPTSGSIKFEGTEIVGMTPAKISRAGIAFVPEDRLVFPNLSVEENLLVGMQKPRPGRPVWTIDEMYRHFPRLGERKHQIASTLSGGEQQMLTICRSLLGNPKILLVDEPTEGLAPQIVALLRDILLAIKARGVSIILVEQRLTMALQISDAVFVMGHGQIAYSGSVSAFKQDTSIRKRWLDVA
ncbi:MAG: ABC transporter ATP-binding protein [Xanthobacteraceae bacterium]|nr:ABC transporter ATP-binding protein [Xanthobacteraceae bacterium]MCW5678230.1 ABC transporter ATP-binding protein [Xanthobacteraceae bacterium]